MSNLIANMLVFVAKILVVGMFTLFYTVPAFVLLYAIMFQTLDFFTTTAYSAFAMLYSAMFVYNFLVVLKDDINP